MAKKKTKKLVIPGPAKGYTDMIDEVLTKNAKEAAEREDYFPLRPSSAGYCTRRLAYDLMNFRGFAKYPKEVKEPDITRLLSLGSSVEWHSIRNFELIPDLYPEFRVKYKQQAVTLFRLDETKARPPELIEGSIDLSMVVSGAGGIGDVKSVKDKFSAAYRTKWDESVAKFNGMSSLVAISEQSWYAPDLIAFLDELNDPFFAHNFWQVNSYLCTDWAKEHGFDHGFIYRYCKNDSRHLEIRFPPTPELFEAFRDKCNTVNAAVDQKKPELAERDYGLGSIVCAYCPYSNQCWGDRDALKAFYNNLPPTNWPKDLDRIKGGEELINMFEAYEDLTTQEAKRQRLEQEISKELSDRELKKIRLPNGNIYELRYYKGDDALKIKRSKL